MACDSTGRREQADLADINNEAPASFSHRRPRLFTVREKNVLEPQNNLNARWETCTPDSAKSFSAGAYFFGKELYHRLGVPIGLIHTSWPGTSAEDWATPESLRADPVLTPILQRWAATSAESKALAAHPAEKFPTPNEILWTSHRAPASL